MFQLLDGGCSQFAHCLVYNRQWLRKTGMVGKGRRQAGVIHSERRRGMGLPGEMWVAPKGGWTEEYRLYRHSILDSTSKYISLSLKLWGASYLLQFPS